MSYGLMSVSCAGLSVIDYSRNVFYKQRGSLSVNNKG